MWFHKSWNKALTLVFLILLTTYLSIIHLKYIFILIWNVTSIWICFRAKTMNLDSRLPLQNSWVHLSFCVSISSSVSDVRKLHYFCCYCFQPGMPLFINFTKINGSSVVPVFVLSTEIQKKIRQTPWNSHCSKPKPELFRSNSAVLGQVSLMQENSGLQSLENIEQNANGGFLWGCDLSWILISSAFFTVLVVFSIRIHIIF